MPNSTVPANATLLPAARFDRAAIMRRAWELARMFREDEVRAYRNRHSGALRHGGKVPPLVLPSWRQCMSEALTIAWREARAERAMTPAVCEEIEAVELTALTIMCSDRPAHADIAHAFALRSRAAEMRAAFHA